jgi:hypothetical protein
MPIGFDRGLVTTILRACTESCRLCYEECRRHALHSEYCQVCGAACVRCARACREMPAALGG